jgi:hypothetical protein
MTLPSASTGTGGAPTGGSRGVGRVVAAVAVALALAITSWIASTTVGDDSPRLEPLARGSSREADAAANDLPGTSPPAASTEGTMPTRAEQGSRAPGSGTSSTESAAERPPSAVDRLRRPSRVQVNGQLVDPVGQPLDWDAVREALPGEPIVVRVRSEAGAAPCILLPGGAMRGVIAATREGALPPVAQLELAGRVFRAKVDLSTDEPFRLAVDLAGLTEAFACVTIIARPMPETQDPRNGIALLVRGAATKESRLDRDGRARFATLTAGHWLGMVEVDGRAPTPFDVLVEAREQKEVLVELERAFSLQGRVTFVDGTPVPGAVVTAERTGVPLRLGVDPDDSRISIGVGLAPFDRAQAVVDVDGEYELLALPAGEYALEVHGEFHGDARQPVRGRLQATMARLGSRERERVDFAVDRPAAGGIEPLLLMIVAPNTDDGILGAERLFGRPMTARFLDGAGHPLASEVAWFQDLRGSMRLLRPAGAVRIEVSCWRRRGDWRLLSALATAASNLPDPGSPDPIVVISIDPGEP